MLNKNPPYILYGMKQQIMGILNITPDSFYDGSDKTFDEQVQKGIRLIEEGADILDIGGESSRPGAKEVSIEEELRRVLPVIQELRKTSAISISIDTKKPMVAKKALQAGATLINDITGFENEEMRIIAKDFGAEVCVMHMQGSPETMQNRPFYPEGIVAHLRQFFERRVDLLMKLGIPKEKIILDPGIGFGKSVVDNLEILKNISFWRLPGFRVLIGLSRKSFMMKILNKNAKGLLPATLAMNTMALLFGADIIRVHDVIEHKDVVRMMSSMVHNARFTV